MRNFKKLFLLIGIFGLASGVSSCSEGSKTFTTNEIKVKVATPSKAPAVALFAHLKEGNVEINSAANNVIAYLTTTSDKDMVIAPTNAGISAIVQRNAEFKIAATVTFGNFYLLTTGKDNDNKLSEGDKVLAFQETNVAGRLFKYVYGDLNLNTTYLADVTAVKNEILTNSNFDYDYVLLAQPDVNEILRSQTAYSVYANVQTDFKAKSGGKEITQASIFVKNTSNKDDVVEALNTIKNDVDALLDNTSNLIEATKDVENEVFASKLGSTKEELKSLLDDNNQLGIGFKKAKDNKASIDEFISTFGMGKTSEEIYFNY